jgi:transcriptional regulator with XRE-family HTH domain
VKHPVYCPDCLSTLPEVPLGVQFRSLHVAAGMTQKELAQRTGLTDRTVRACEAESRRHWPDTLEQLSRALGLRLEDAKPARSARNR